MPYTQVPDGFVSFSEARDTVIAHGIRTSEEYLAKSKQWRVHHRLPSNPHISYPSQWRGWAYFTGRPKTARSMVKGPKKDFVSFAEARAIVKAQGVQSMSDYLARGSAWRERHRLPQSPYVTYYEHWQGWPHFLGRDRMTGRWERGNVASAREQRA